MRAGKLAKPDERGLFSDNSEYLAISFQLRGQPHVHKLEYIVRFTEESLLEIPALAMEAGALEAENFGMASAASLPPTRIAERQAESAEIVRMV